MNDLQRMNELKQQIRSLMEMNRINKSKHEKIRTTIESLKEIAVYDFDEDLIKTAINALEKWLSLNCYQEKPTKIPNHIVIENGRATIYRKS